MAITHALVTSGTVGTFNPSTTTASVTPGANKLQLIMVRGARSAIDPQTPTLTGNGLTWVSVVTVGYFTSGSPIRRIWIFRALGASPTTGAVTITVAAPGWGGASWSWVEFDGIDTSGTNGSGAIVQSGSLASTGVSSFAVALAALADPANALFGGYGRSNNTDDFTPGTNFLLAHNVSDATNGRIGTEYAIPGETDGDVDGSWSGNATFGALGVEIKVAPAAGGISYVRLERARRGISRGVSIGVG